MLASNGKITMRQLQILIILSALGTGVIVLPRRVAEFAGQDGWVIVALLAVLAVLVGLLISAAVSAATKTKPNAGFIEFTSFLLTRPVAYICGAVLWAKLIVSAGLELRVFMEITQTIMLPQTPIPVVSLAVLLVCAYAAAKGMEARARVAEVLFAIMILPFLFLVVLALFDTNFSNLQPVLITPPRDLFQGTLRLGFIFAGLECLLLVSPFIRKPRQMGRHVAYALGFAGGIILLITVLTIAKFGHGVANQPWPVLRMMDMLNIPGSFIERQEALMFSFWIITAFAIGNTMLFFSGLLVKDMFKPKAKYVGVIVSTAAVFAVSIFPWHVDVYRIMDFIYLTVGLFFLVLLPIFLIMAAKLRTWADKTSGRTLAKSSSLLVLLVCIVLSFAGCWDRVEIENRSFVVAIGIDSDDDEYVVSLSIPLLKKNEDDESDKPHHIKTATGRTVTEAMKKLDAKTDRTLYYGQAKLLILGEDLLAQNNMTSSVIQTLINKNEIDLRINVLAADGKAQDILEAKPPGETLPGLFVADIYRNKNKFGGTSFALDLERLSLSYRDGAIIPVIKHDDCESTPIKLHGAALIKYQHKIGDLTPEELQGYLWCMNHGNNGAVVTLDIDGDLIPVYMKKHSTKISFEPLGEGIRAVVDVKVAGHVGEPPDEHIGMEQIKQELSNKISLEITTTATKLQEEYALDGYDWLELLRQKNYGLYKIHAQNWHDVFAQIEIVSQVVVELYQ